MAVDHISDISNTSESINEKKELNEILGKFEIAVVEGRFDYNPKNDIQALIANEVNKARIDELEYWFGVYIENPRQMGQIAMIDINEVEEHCIELLSLTNKTENK